MAAKKKKVGVTRNNAKKGKAKAGRGRAASKAKARNSAT
jgi:hypothetical protein